MPRPPPGSPAVVAEEERIAAADAARPSWQPKDGNAKHYNEWRDFYNMAERQLGPEEAFTIPDAAQVSMDPAVREMQMAALQNLSGIASGSGFNAGEKAAQYELKQKNDLQERSQREALMSQAAGRGTAGSSASLMSRLSAQQGAANRNYATQQAQLGQGFDRRLQASGMMGNLANGVGGLDNSMQQFNSQIAQQTNQFNAGAKQQRFQNWMDLAAGKQNAKQGMAAQKYQDNMQDMNNFAGYAGAVGGIASGAGAVGSAVAASDERVKENVGSGDRHIDEMLAKLQPKKFDYKEGVEDGGTHVGIMAQDLEQTDAGKGAVVELGGVKHVDPGQASTLTLAALARISSRLDALEGKNAV